MPVATTDNVQGAAPAGWLSGFGDVLVNGVGRWIDIELSEKAGLLPSQQEVRWQNPDADLNRPRTLAAGIAGFDLNNPLMLAAVVVAGAVAYSLFKGR